MKIIAFAFLSLLFLSCSKPDEKDPQIETMQPHQTWTDSSSNFFDNLKGYGIQTDTYHFLNPSTPASNRQSS